MLNFGEKQAEQVMIAFTPLFPSSIVQLINVPRKMWLTCLLAVAAHAGEGRNASLSDFLSSQSPSRRAGFRQTTNGRKKAGEAAGAPLCTFLMQSKGITTAIKPNPHLSLRMKRSEAGPRVYVRSALTSSSSG